MSRLDRAVGLLRSLAIYHAVPMRQRNLRRLYSQFAQSGDLVFDIGAHAGNHVRAALALGCRIVAVEPQPDFARLLRTMYGRLPQVTVIESAVGARPGTAALAISDRTPTVTSLSAGWRDDRASDPGFAGVEWNRRIDVEVATLDQLIARFGMPAFVKLDVEGSESAVLAGLSHPVPAIAFEYLPSALEPVDACLSRLAALGRYVFNWSPGESHRLASRDWLDEHDLRSSLRSAEAQRRSGDVYARLVVSVT